MIPELEFIDKLNIPEEISDWYLKKASDAVKSSPSEEATHSILRKITHMWEVVTVGRHVYQGEKARVSFKATEAEVACLLHDVGRFVEAYSNPNLLHNKRIDHGELGYAMYRQTVFFQHEVGESIRDHNKRYTDGKSQLTNFVRDADKVVILSEYPYQIDLAKGKYSDGDVSMGVLSDLEKGIIIEVDKLTSMTDVYFYILGFLYDLNYKTSLEYILDKELLEPYLQWVDLHVSKDTVSTFKTVSNAINAAKFGIKVF
jgi:hypothetical protein